MVISYLMAYVPKVSLLTRMTNNSKKNLFCYFPPDFLKGTRCEKIVLVCSRCWMGTRCDSGEAKGLFFLIFKSSTMVKIPVWRCCPQSTRRTNRGGRRRSSIVGWRVEEALSRKYYLRETMPLALHLRQVSTTHILTLRDVHPKVTEKKDCPNNRNTPHALKFSFKSCQCAKLHGA